ncbi:MAG: hypothetical protein QM527_03005 [Alphaproteobacteria bacterium]|nr:hypothetical protein [Alphaproteobacteria bacterium]
MRIHHLTRHALGLLLWGASTLTHSQGVPDGAGKSLVDGVCNSCHLLTQRVGGGYTPQGWDTVLRMMTNHGLNLTADQLALAKNYLAQAYPEKPKPPAVLIDGRHQITLQA